MNTSMVFIKQAQIGLDTSVVADVYVIMRIGMEGTIYQCRIFRRYMYAESVLMDTCQQAERNSTFFFPVQISDQCMGIVAADISFNRYVKGFLERFGTGFDTAAEQDFPFCLRRVEIDGIQRQTVGA